MTKKTLLYLKDLGLSAEDVEILLEVAPEIMDAADDDIIKNIELVISYGYPRLDIGTLIQVNPLFLIISEELLDDLLRDLGSNIEEKLKANPFLI